MNRGTTALFASLSVLMGLSFSDTAQGQTMLIFNPNPPVLNFSLASGQISSQQIQVTSNSQTTLQVTIPNNPPAWLTVSPLVASVAPGTPATFTVTVNTNSVSTGVQTPATFTIGINGQPAGSATTVTVNLTVGANTSLFSASPSSLSFTGVQGSTVGFPSQNIVQINNSGGSTLDYTLNVSTTDGHNWLLVSPSCASASINPCVAGTGSGFAVSVNPSATGLVAGMTYRATITAQSTSTADSVSIPVTFALNTNSTLTVAPPPLQPFLFQIGSSGVLPAQQTLAVTSSAGSVPFTDAVTSSQGGNWLVPGISGSTATSTPTPIPLLISSSGIPSTPGKYTDVLTITPNNGSAAVPVSVSLVVTSNPLLQLNNNALTFSSQFGATTTSPQQVTLTSTGGLVGFMITPDPTATWLSATVVGSANTASSTIPATLNLTVNPSGLAAGTYTGTLQISPTNGDPYALPITVTLNVITTSQLTAAPPLLHFSWETSQTAPPFQNVTIGSVGQPVAFTVSLTPTTVTANCPANWLQVGTPTSNTTPATVPIGISVGGMTAGFCTGTVVITPASGSGATVLNIPVTVDVASTPLLNVSFPVGFGVQTVAQGAVASTLQIPLTSTDLSSQAQFTATSSTSWLAVAPTALSSTPQNLQVVVSPSQLTPGKYNATITISSASLPSGSISVPYSLTVTPDITVAVTPTGTVTLTQPQGGPVPQVQNLTLTSTGGSAQYTAQVNPVTGGNWLQINSGTTASGTLNPSGTLALSINPAVANSLSAGTYTSTISLAFPGSATANMAITVTLAVASQTITVSPTTLAFAYQIGGATPASQPLNVTSTGGVVNFVATATSTGNWLSIDTSSGTTPKTINVLINPANLPAGSVSGSPLTGTVSISAPTVQSTPLTVNVTLTVTASPTPQPTTITGGASLIPGAIAPGEFITIKGTNLGPATAASFSLNAQGGVGSTLGGVQVLFDSIPGTPTYVSATQINVIVPYELAGRTATNITVVSQGMTSAVIPQQVVAAAPSIFTFNATGQGQAVAGNVTGATAGTDNGPSAGVPILGGTVSSSPATQGSFIFVYGTGGGLTSPATTTGSVNSSTTLMPITNWTATSGTVTATIGGQPAKVTFAGAAPGLISGVYQFDIQVPTGISGNALALVITVNGVSTPSGPTVAVQ